MSLWFVRLKGRGWLEINPDKSVDAARWDSLHGVTTNLRGVSNAELNEASSALDHEYSAWRPFHKC